MDWQFAALEKEKNICGIDISVTGLNGTECSNEQEVDTSDCRVHKLLN